MKKITLSVIAILTCIAYDTSNARDKGNNPLEVVYDSYFTLKDALVKSDGKSAQHAAELLFNSIAAVQLEQLSSEQHEIWVKCHQKLSDDTGQIKKSDNNGNLLLPFRKTFIR